MVSHNFAVRAIFWREEPEKSDDHDTSAHKPLKSGDIVLVLRECKKCPVLGGRFYFVLSSSNHLGYVYESVMKPQAYA